MLVLKYVRTTLLTIFGEEIFADIKDSNTGFRNVHPREMLRVIYTQHAVLNREDVIYINALASAPIDTTLGAPIATFVQNQQRAHELSQDTRHPLNESVLANNLHQAYARLDFENAHSSYMTYGRLDESLKTWKNAKKFFARCYREAISAKKAHEASQIQKIEEAEPWDTDAPLPRNEDVHTLNSGKTRDLEILELRAEVNEYGEADRERGRSLRRDERDRSPRRGYPSDDSRDREYSPR